MLRELEEEEALDMENERNSNKVSLKISLDVIPDNYWKALVAVLGLVLVFYEVYVTLDVVQQLLQGGGGGGEEEAVDPEAVEGDAEADATMVGGGERLLSQVVPQTLAQVAGGLFTYKFPSKIMDKNEEVKVKRMKRHAKLKK